VHPGKIKKGDLLNVAMTLAEQQGYSHIKRDEIAKLAGVAMGSVNLHLGTMHKIRKSVVRRAIKTENLRIIAQALIARDPLVDDMDVDLRLRALNSI
jgi:AcrR family transcriptional regulator